MNYLYRSFNSRHRSGISNKKEFPLDMKLLNLSVKRRKKEKKTRAEKNKRRTAQIPEKGNKFPPTRDKEVHETIGKNQAIKIDNKCPKYGKQKLLESS